MNKLFFSLSLTPRLSLTDYHWFQLFKKIKCLLQDSNAGTKKCVCTIYTQITTNDRGCSVTLSFLHCCRSNYFFQSVFEFFGGALPSDWHFAFFNNSVDLLQFSVQFRLLVFGTRPPCLASIRHLDSVLEGSSVNLQHKITFGGYHQTRI